MPNKLVSTIKLARFDKPIGIFLLWYPTAFALWLYKTPNILLIIKFFLGTIFMRTAGCIINDLADRNIDPYVERTKNRPLAARDISIYFAFFILSLNLVGALLILLSLPFSCYKYAVVSLAVTVLYPFCKRFFVAPQFILGLAFSMGIPMALSAQNLAFDAKASLLFILNILWILIYDTQYALVDKKYDIKIGIYSTAILFGENCKIVLQILQIIMHTGFLYLFWPRGIYFYISWLLALMVLYKQNLLIDANKPNPFKAFLSNNWYGFVLWLGLIVS